MVLILEIVLLFIGLWALFSGKIPMGLNKFIFGKNACVLSPNKTRLMGLFFLTPLPVSFVVLFVLAIFFGSDATFYGIIFEFLYILFVVGIADFVLKKEKNHAIQEGRLEPDEPSEKKTRDYYLRLIIIFGIGLLSLVTFISGLFLLMLIFTSMEGGVYWAGNFWDNILPFILLFAIMGFALFGFFKLVQALRKNIVNKSEDLLT